MSEKLDERKMALEERRLDFEIRKHDDEKPNRAVELDKLNEEVRELKRPFYMKPSYMTPTATICAAVVGGVLAFGTNIFNSKITDLKSTKDTLNREVTNLSAKDNQLNSQITKANSTIASLNGQIAALNQTRASLAARLPVERVKGLLSVLIKRARSESIVPNDPTYQEVLMAAKNALKGSPVMAQIMAAHDDQNTPNALRPALACMLYQTTKNSRWKQVLSADATAQIVDVISNTNGFVNQVNGNFIVQVTARDVALPYFFYLDDKEVFSSSERAANLKALYARMPRAEVFDTVIEVNDKDVLTLFRDPWINSWKLELSWPASQGFSPEGYAARVISEIAKTPENKPASFHVDSNTFDNCQFPPDVPICADIAQLKTQLKNYASEIPVSDARRREYVTWSQKHEQLVLLFVPPGNDFSKMRSLPDDIFRDIINKIWVTDERIH